MKHLFALTDWNLVAIRRQLFGMAVLMGPLEYLWMTAYAFLADASGAQESTLFTQSGAFFVLCVCMAAAELFNFSVSVRREGRIKGVYTQMSLPVPRGMVFCSRILSGVLAVLAMVGTQVLWYLVLVVPVQAMTNRSFIQGVALAPGFGSFLQDGFFLNVMRAAPLRIVAPFSWFYLLIHLSLVVCTVIALESVMTHRGWKRGVQWVLFAIAIFAALLWYALRFRQNVELFELMPNAVLLMMELLLGAISLVWALYAFSAAKNL